MKRFVRIGFTAFVAMWSSGDTTSAQERRVPRVAILMFAPTADAAAIAHWGVGLSKLISSALDQCDGIRPARRPAIEFAYRELGVRADAPLDADQAGRAARTIEADFVVWGELSATAGEPTVSLVVAEAATDTVLLQRRIRSVDWNAVRDDSVEQVLDAIGVTRTAEESRRATVQWTDSTIALDRYIRAYAAQLAGAPLPDQLALLRGAQAADPESTAILEALAAVHANQGDFETAWLRMDRATDLGEPSYQGRLLLAVLLRLHKHNLPAAEARLQRARDSRPGYPEAYASLGGLRRLENRWPEAVTFYERARELERFDAHTRAALALAYAIAGRTAEARIEIREALRIQPEDSPLLETIARAYETLRDVAEAADCYERFVAYGRETGFQPSVVDRAAKAAEFLRASLAETPVDTEPPRALDEVTIQRVLAAALSTEQLEHVSHPLTGSAAIGEWAQEVVAGKDSDLARCRALFELLVARVQTTRSWGKRTALEVFVAWRDTDQAFNCQELAKLFIALARSVGVRAHLVHVERDYRDVPVEHDCAIVFVGEDAYLVDPAYRWFGVPHRDYVVLDDVQAIAHQMFQGQRGEEPRAVVARCRAACRIHPDFAWGYAKLARALIQIEAYDEAQRFLDRARALESPRWFVRLLVGLLAYQRGDRKTAEREFRNGLQEHPDHPRLNARLAVLLANSERLQEARDLLRRAARQSDTAEESDEIRRLLAEINRKLRD